MMRISEISRSETVVRLRIEGRLTQLNAAELSAAVASSLTGRCTVLLDLANVAFADASGVEALRTLRAKGVVMIACSEFLADMMQSNAAIAGAFDACFAAAQCDGEEALVGRLRQGDDAAFAELVERNIGRMLAT